AARTGSGTSTPTACQVIDPPREWVTRQIPEHPRPGRTGANHVDSRHHPSCAGPAPAYLDPDDDRRHPARDRSGAVHPRLGRPPGRRTQTLLVTTITVAPGTSAGR